MTLMLQTTYPSIQNVFSSSVVEIINLSMSVKYVSGPNYEIQMFVVKFLKFRGFTNVSVSLHLPDPCLYFIIFSF